MSGIGFIYYFGRPAVVSARTCLAANVVASVPSLGSRQGVVWESPPDGDGPYSGVGRRGHWKGVDLVDGVLPVTDEAVDRFGMQGDLPEYDATKDSSVSSTRSRWSPVAQEVESGDYGGLRCSHSSYT